MATNGIPEILIISQGSAFMVNSLENNLKKEGLYITRCEPMVRDVDEHIDGKDMVILFAGEYITGSGAALSYISSKCADECIHFCVVGYPNEIQEIEKSVGVALVTAELPRPFDMKDFCTKIKAIANGETVKASVDAQNYTVNNNKRHSILLCDDDMMFLKMVQEWLKDAYNITIVKTGLMAVPFALNNQPDLIMLDFEMPVRLVDAGPLVKEDLGKRAVQRGPLVYCIEEVDNPEGFDSLRLTEEARFDAAFDPELLRGVVAITAESAGGRLRFIPYYAWDNREAGRMKVWVPLE